MERRLSGPMSQSQQPLKGYANDESRETAAPQVVQGHAPPFGVPSPSMPPATSPQPPLTQLGASAGFSELPAYERSPTARYRSFAEAGQLAPHFAAQAVPDDASNGGLYADRGRPSHKLRELVESVQSAEMHNETLQEQNYRFRIRCLQYMRSNSVIGRTRAAFSAWVAAYFEIQRVSALQSQRLKLLARFMPLFERKCGGGGMPMLGQCFSGWRRSLEALRDENHILGELDAHRKGRSQLILQYRELEAELFQERRHGQECRARLDELSAKMEQLQQELAWAGSSLQAQTHDAEEQRSRARSLEDQLRESQDRRGDLKKELRTQTERVRRLEQQLESEERNKEDLHDQLLRMERVADGLRGEASRRDADSSRSREAIQDKDAQIAALEAQLFEMQGVIQNGIESLSRHRNTVAAGAGLSAIAAAAVNESSRQELLGHRALAPGGAAMRSFIDNAEHMPKLGFNSHDGFDVGRVESHAQIRRLEDLTKGGVQLNDDQMQFMYRTG